MFKKVNNIDYKCINYTTLNIKKKNIYYIYIYSKLC